MHSLARYTVAALLLLAITVHAVIYRTIQLKAGFNATLPCYELENYDNFKMWVTPNRVYIGADFNPDEEKFHIDETTGSLDVFNLKKADSGDYLCISQPNGQGSDYRNVTVTLNVLDVSYLPEIDDWEANLWRGIISAVCTAAFFIGACGLHHFSWHNRHKLPKDFEVGQQSARSSKRSIAPDHVANGIDNPALSVDAKEAESGL